MSARLSITELAEIVLPYGAREGLFLMLRAYFDDSGTHSSSRVVVIGGLVGTEDQWRGFEAAWAAKLADPLPEAKKPALKMFHLSHCNGGWGEFASYTDTEADAVTHDFRQIVIGAGLISMAWAIDRIAWNELVIGPHLAALGEPLAYCTEQAVHETYKVAMVHPQGARIAATFDQGIYSDRLKAMLDPITHAMGVPRVVHIGWSPVACLLPLQGADIVATENYWHIGKILQLGDDAQPRAHMRHYLDNMLHEGYVLDRAAITALVSGPALPPSPGWQSA